jgi:hypothetical protein
MPRGVSPGLSLHLRNSVLPDLHEERRGNNPAINPTGSNLLLTRIYWLLPLPHEKARKAESKLDSKATNPMTAVVPAPSPFLASTRRFVHRLRSVLPTWAMSPSSSAAPVPSAGEEGAPSLPHTTLEVAGASRGLLSGFASLRAPYRPFPVLASNRHVETIFAAFVRSLPTVRLRRECLRAPDDGAVALDWVCGDDRALPPGAPVLVLLVPCSFPASFEVHIYAGILCCFK